MILAHSLPRDKICKICLRKPLRYDFPVSCYYSPIEIQFFFLLFFLSLPVIDLENSLVFVSWSRTGQCT